MFRRILVPTDGSDLSSVAEQAAIAFAQACGSELVALAIAQPEPVVPLVEGAIVVPPLGMDVLQEHAQSHVGRIADAAAKAGVKCTTRTGFGYSPADEIVAAAKREGCDLVFMASHGRRGLSRLIAGSVTQQVLAYSTVPVMVYRPQLAQMEGRPGTGQAPARP